MTATSNPVPDNEPDAVEALLPWYVNGTLSAGEVRRVEQALADRPALAAQLAVICDDAAETIHLNELLGAPSSRAVNKLFAVIDAEPVSASRRSSSLSLRIAGFFASVSPRALASAAAVAAVVLVLQAGVIGTVLFRHGSTYQTASYQAPRAAAETVALIRFAPDARVSDIDDLLGKYHASVVDGPKSGMFRVSLGDRPLSKDENARIIAQLQAEKIVSFVAVAE